MKTNENKLIVTKVRIIKEFESAGIIQCTSQR